MIRLIQKYRVDESSGLDKHSALIKEIKHLQVRKADLKDKVQNFLSSGTLPKVYDFDETVKFKMSYRKNIRRLNSESLSLPKSSI